MARARATGDNIPKSALDIELEKIEKDFGKGSVMRSSIKPDKIDVISTGSFNLDRATGIGGLARGKVVELIGWESSGKTTIAYQTIANAQKLGLEAVLIDGENSFDANYARALGIDVDKLLIIQLDDGGAEKCYNLADRLMRTKGVGIVVIDSQTSLLPKKAFDGEIGDSKLGLQARLMSESVPKIVNAASLGNTTVIYISQFREKIGVMFGNPETTSGGNALRFYAHMRIEVRKSVEKVDGVATANKTRCKIIKNKLAVPFKEAEFKIIFGKGIDRDGEIIERAIEQGIIGKSGSWYSYEGVRIGQGENSVAEMVRDNPEFREELAKKLKDEENTSQERENSLEEIKIEGSEGNKEGNRDENEEDQSVAGNDETISTDMGRDSGIQESLF